MEQDTVDRSWPGPRTTVADDLEHAVASALNRFSAENGSNTPDFILAQFLIACLTAFNGASRHREQWYGQSLSIGGPNTNTRLREFCGWLSADIPELHVVPVPLLADSLERFLQRVAALPVPAGDPGPKE